MTKEQEALDKFLKEYLFLCEKLHTNMQEKMLLDSNSPYNILKQSFEKAPEPIQTGIDLGVIKPKKYLKWEDLKFEKKQQVMDVLLNGKPYILYFYKLSAQNEVNIFAIDMHIVTLNSYYKEDIQFFNDLHLEVVE